MADVNINKYRASVVRSGSTPATPGYVASEGQNPVDPSGSAQNHLPVTINPTATGLSITDSQILSGAGTVGQYIRGDGSLADFPSSSGGGSSVSYYLNGSVSQGTIGGVAYKELNKVPILGTGTDFTINADGYIAQFLTDAGDPGLLEIPGGNWNFETYFSASSSGGSPSFYVELYKYDGSTFTLIASSSSSPELIAFGTNINPYFSTLAVPTTSLALTDRLAVRYYVTHSGRTITLHTENNHLCQVITTFTTGLTSLNGLTAQVQNLAVGTSGTDFNIVSATATHTFNLPTASATNRGALSSADWSTFNNKQNALTLTTTGTSGAATLVGATLNIPQYQSVLTNPVTGTGTTNYLPKFTGASTIGNSNVIDNGTTVSVLNSAYTDVFRVGSSSNSLYFYPDGGSVNIMTGAGFSGSGITFAGGSNYLDFNTNSLFRMRLSTAGNLLIGTTSDGGQRLQVTGTVAMRASASISSATQIPIFNADPSGTTRELVTRTPAQLLSDIGGQAALTNPVTGTGTTNYLPKFTGSTTIGNSNLINDSSGNLGLGVTPSAWISVYKAFNIGLSGLIYSRTDTDDIAIGLNWYRNSGGSFLYNSNGYATIYAQNAGVHYWYNAPSGTAGNAISFTQAMTLTSGGNLLVGTTTSGGAKLEVVGDTYLRTQVFTDTIRPYTGNQLQLLNGGSNFLYINGSVGIGTSNPLQKLHITQAADTAYPTLGTGKGALFIAGDTNLYGLYVGINTSDGNTYFQAMRNNSATAYNIIMQAAGGNVLIGTTTDAGFKLDVNGTSRSSVAYKFGTYTQGSTTPNVSNVSIMIISNSSPTTITNFTNAVAGQVLTLGFSDSNTTINRANAYLLNGNNYTSGPNDFLQLVFDGTYWFEISRSSNA